MSRAQRLALVAAAIVVAVVAFVIVSSGGDDSNGGGGRTSAAGGGSPTVARIEIQGDSVQGGARTIRVDKGEPVRIVVSADKPNAIHLHGYDIEKEATPKKPARFAFTADAEGVFELESHTFEDAGLDAVLGKLVVGPS